MLLLFLETVLEAVTLGPAWSWLLARKHLLTNEEG